MLARFARTMYRRRRIVLATWIVALVGVTVLGNVAGGEHRVDYAMPGSESARVQELLGERFPEQSGDTIQLVAIAPEGVTGPTVAAVDPTGAWLFVVNRESRNVAIIPSSRRSGDDVTFATTGSSVRALIPVGHGANGIALTRDGKKAYVYNQFDHTVHTLTQGNDAQVVKYPELCNCLESIFNISLRRHF